MKRSVIFGNRNSEMNCMQMAVVTAWTNEDNDFRSWKRKAFHEAQVNNSRKCESLGNTGLNLKVDFRELWIHRKCRIELEGSFRC